MFRGDDQVERFGTSWAIDAITTSTKGGPIQIITGISERGFTFLHSEHRAGLDIDVGIALPVTLGGVIVHPRTIGQQGRPGYVSADERLAKMTFSERLDWYLASTVDHDGDSVTLNVNQGLSPSERRDW